MREKLDEDALNRSTRRGKQFQARIRDTREKQFIYVKEGLGAAVNICYFL